MKIGDKYEIVGVKGPSGSYQRLLEFGLIRGRKFSVAAIGPFGDPIMIDVAGAYRIGIRISELELLDIKKL